MPGRAVDLPGAIEPEIVKVLEAIPGTYGRGELGVDELASALERVLQRQKLTEGLKEKLLVERFKKGAKKSAETPTGKYVKKFLAERERAKNPVEDLSGLERYHKSRLARGLEE